MSTAPIAPDGAQCALPAPTRQPGGPARQSRRRQPADARVKRNWRGHFIAALIETSNVTRAAEAAGVTTSRAYHARARCPNFHRLWQAAQSEGYRNLEMEVLGYLRDPNPGYKMDVSNAIRVLTLHKQSQAEQVAQDEAVDEADVLESITAMIEDMRKRNAANTALLDEPDQSDESD